MQLAAAVFSVFLGLLASGRGTQGPSPIRTINHMEAERCYTVPATKPSSKFTSCPEILLAAGDAEKLWLHHLRPFRSMCLLVWVRMHHDEQSGASPGLVAEEAPAKRTLRRGARHWWDTYDAMLSSKTFLNPQQVCF